MKPKKTALPRRRVSFAVDRDEIEINSDWVQAVMARPAEPVAPARPAEAAPGEAHPARNASLPPRSAASDINNATEAESSTDAKCTSVEESAAVENAAPVEQSAAVADSAPVSASSTVADLATVEQSTTDELASTAYRGPWIESISVEDSAPVAVFAADEDTASVPEPISTEDHSAGSVSSPPVQRKPRPRPIHRITDGLTPGQYAVYSLMFESGEAQDGAEEVRIYRGGYADLCRLTGLSKRGIQNIVGELQEKNVIGIHRAPGYHRTETSVYRVPAASAVVREWHARGWRFALGKSKTLVASVPRY